MVSAHHMHKLHSSICETVEMLMRLNVYAASWYLHRQDENVLWLHYEDLKANLPKCVEMISNFLDIGKHDSKLKELVVEQVIQCF